VIDVLFAYDTLILFVLSLVAWFTLGIARVVTGRKTISAQVRDLDRIWPSVGFLFALVVALLMGHFFLNPGVPFVQVAGIAVAIAFGLIAGAIWFR
jgi:hypothetical protein